MIDPKRLPATAMIDTMTLRFAIEPASTDVRAPPSKQLLEAMVGAARPVYVAAPTISEILQWHGHSGPPLTELVQTLAFDHLTATLLGKRLPADLLKEAIEGTGIWPNGGAWHHYKYDALILACALRWEMETLVTYDDHLQKLCTKHGQKWDIAENFQAAAPAPPSQASLHLVTAVAPIVHVADPKPAEVALDKAQKK